MSVWGEIGKDCGQMVGLGMGNSILDGASGVGGEGRTQSGKGRKVFHS